MFSGVNIKHLHILDNILFLQLAVFLNAANDIRYLNILLHDKCKVAADGWIFAYLGELHRKKSQPEPLVLMLSVPKD